MRTIKALIVVIVSGLLSGCWNVSRLPPPQRECWSNPEQLSERVRSLPGVAEHQVLEMAERLLRLTWREDVKIIRSPHRLTAEVRRDRSFYLFLVAYRGIADESWTIATRPEPDGTGVCVQLQGQYLTDTFVLGAEPITSLIYPATMTAQAHGHFLPRAQPIAVGFDTFWARLDYLLGLKQGWTACRSSGPRRNETYGRTEFDPLCHSLADDSGQPPLQVIERP
jgi:hypothetical protein